MMAETSTDKKRKHNGSSLAETHVPQKRVKRTPSPQSEPPPAPVSADAVETAGAAPKSFQELGIIDSLCDACTALGFKVNLRRQSARVCSKVPGS